MFRTLPLLLLGSLVLLDPETTLAAVATTPVSAAATEAATEAVAETGVIPRPNYKPYRGNSRTKRKRFWLFRKWAARRKARRQRKAVPARRGVIRVEPPTGAMPKN